MLATDRDRQIVLLIGRFKQLTSGQLQELIFSDGSSVTPLKRALKRLLASRHIARIERRLVGGSGAGSGQYVYQLGSQGWALCGREGRYWPFRSVDYHMLAIADAYVALKRSERAASLSVTTYETEPDTWQEVSGVKLTPDLYLELSIPSKRATVVLWVEVDTGTERQKQIKDKYARYWHAYQHVNTQAIAIWPLVLFLTPDAQRTYDLRRWLDRGPVDARELFAITEQDQFPSLLL